MRFRTTGVFILLFSALFTLVAFGQKFQSQPLNNYNVAPYNYQFDKREYIPQLSSELFQLYELYTSNGDFVQFAKKRNLNVADNSVFVTLLPRSGYKMGEIADALSEYNVIIEAQASNSMRCRIPINRLRDVVRKVRGIQFISNLVRPIPDAVDGEGTYLMNADTWQNEGIDGSGVKVAIIDGGFQKLSDAQANGDIPSTYYGKDYTGSGLESETEHGTAVAEAAYEVAPGADYYYYHIGDLTDLENAKDDLVSHGVDVVNHSMSWFVQSYYDGTGPVSDIVADAINNDVVWCNSAGNRADSHYRNVFTEAADGFHDMDGEGRKLNFFGPEPGYVWLFPRFYVIQLWMNWDAYPTTNQDYDLYLYRFNDSSEEWDVVASATNRQDGTIAPVETIAFFNTVDEAKFAFAVKKYNATLNADFTVFTSDPIANRVYSSSITDPGVYEDVVTVGAIARENYDSGPQEDFSGQGPTTDGRAKPNVAGPDNCNSYAYGYWQGTSQSSPYVAGASALARSRFPTYTESQVRDYLYSKCVVDLGDPGFDYIYGYGKLVLPSFESITVTSPNGGENWNVGSSHNITWTSDGTSGAVKLEYSINNGSNWTTIEANTLDDGFYEWTVPDSPSSQCLVRVSDVDGDPSDVSDTVFEIMSNTVIQEIPLSTGWNWFSMNIEDANMTLNNVLSSIAPNGEFIKNQTSFSTYYGEPTGWYSSNGLDAIDTKSMYMIRMATDDMLSFEGTPVDYANTTIALSTGWNWIGYLPQTANSVNAALLSIDPNGEFLKNQTSFSTFYGAPTGWYSSNGLDNMEPGIGYMLKMAADDGLIYGDSPGSLAKSNVSRKDSSPSAWTVNVYKFEHSMAVTGVVNMSGIEISGEYYVIGAFCGDECRGLASLSDFPLNDRSEFGMLIYGEPEDAIEFRIYDSRTNQIMSAIQKLVFRADAIVGNGLTPFVLETSNTILGVENSNVIPENYGLYQNYPNPFNPTTTIVYDVARSGYVRLDIYDVRGSKVMTCVNKYQNAGQYSLLWNGRGQEGDMLTSGVYFYRLVVNDFIQTQKMILAK